MSVSTVRRLEGTRLHPTIDDDEVRWFTEAEVAAVAAELANAPSAKRKQPDPASLSPVRDAGELAALVFERFEQRQSLAEIVIGLRVTPEVVRALFDEWSLGLTEGQLRGNREPSVQRSNELNRVTVDELAARLAQLPDGQLVRISVSRVREQYAHGELEYARLDELGGFYVSGPCAVGEIAQRCGAGVFRVTAYSFSPNRLRWEVTAALPDVE